MKICPQCQTSYTDDTLRFCLQDGTPLAEQTFSDNLGEQETVISPRQTDKVQAPATNAQSRDWTPESREIHLPETPKKTNTASIVAVTALLTIAAVGAGAAGVWFYLRGGGDRQTDSARNVDRKPANAAQPNVANANRSPNVNSNANSNANANATPTPTPAPKLTLNPREIRNIQSEVENIIDDWQDALENLDLDRHLAGYAETVDYYRAGISSLGAVREDKQRAFEAFHSIDLDISNLMITPNETGERATAVFDKEWNFEGEQKNSSGKVRQELQFAKIGGRWRITGEKDLLVYR